MSILKTVSKNLRSLNDSGYGYFVSVDDSDFGRGIYRLDLQGCRLHVFEKGMTLEFSKKNIKIFYSEVLKIVSHISAEVFSKASESKNVSVLIPLEINFSEGVVVFDVPLLVYSRLLIVLNDMLKG